MAGRLSIGGLALTPITKMHSRSPRNILRIPHTLRVVSDCWYVAEESLQTDMKEHYLGVNEESITQMFHGKLTEAMKIASNAQRIEYAFLADLRNAFPDLCSGPELRRLAHGLIVDVTLHKRGTESITGGDIGFMIIRPRIQDSGQALKVGSYRRGLLTQAKLERATGEWGGFTRQQKKVLPDRLQYLALLLYSYEDEERRSLRQFQWQLCHSTSSIEEVAKWLRRRSFPSIVSSHAIIEGIGNGEIGTDDDRIIDEIIAPTKNPALVITIAWPEDGYPGSEVRIVSRRHAGQQTKSHVYVRVGH